jgi:alpha-2-macroglobulin-like protein
VLALATSALLAADGKDAVGIAELARLAKLQAQDGSFPGAAQTITYSYGQSLAIETTALAAMAMMRSPAAYKVEIERALGWIATQRDQYGAFGATQSTILALEAMTRNAAGKPYPADAQVTIAVNGTPVATAVLDDDTGAIELPDIGPHLATGDNEVELRVTKGARVEYSLGAHWYDATPASSPAATVAVTTSLDRGMVRAGRPVRLTATVANTTDEAQPATIARIGIPGGAKFQPWQLDELVERHVVDFVETREREVILYFRDLAPRAKKKVAIELLAQVPGAYVAPPSSVYLYYTDEHRMYQKPLALEVRKPLPKKKKKPVAGVVGATAAGATGVVP